MNTEISYTIRKFPDIAEVTIDVLIGHKNRTLFLLGREVKKIHTKKQMLSLLLREYPTTLSFYQQDLIEKVAECFLVARDELIDQGVIQE